MRRCHHHHSSLPWIAAAFAAGMLAAREPETVGMLLSAFARTLDKEHKKEAKA